MAKTCGSCMTDKVLFRNFKISWKWISACPQASHHWTYMNQFQSSTNADIFQRDFYKMPALLNPFSHKSSHPTFLKFSTYFRKRPNWSWSSSLLRSKAEMTRQDPTGCVPSWRCVREEGVHRHTGWMPWALGLILWWKHHWKDCRNKQSWGRRCGSAG